MSVHDVTADEVARLLRHPGPTDDKYSRGVVGVIAGSLAFRGAAVLACSGAVRAGAGLVRYVGPEEAQQLVLGTRPEVVCQNAHDPLPCADAWVTGPGVADDQLQERAFESAWATGAPTVVDAGALLAFVRETGKGQTKPHDAVLTPHEGEAAQALAAAGEKLSREYVAHNRIGAAERLGDAVGATVLLKGSVTVVASPGAATAVLPEATAWLSTAGTGDVLAGTIGALLAAGLTPRDAAVAGAYLHARAGALAHAGGPLAALDVADRLPAAFGEF